RHCGDLGHGHSGQGRHVRLQMEPQRQIEQASRVQLAWPGLTMHVAGASPERDSPRAAFARLSRRANVAIVIALLALSALAWHSTIEDAVSMRGMVMGLGQIGWLAQGEHNGRIFFADWG